MTINPWNDPTTASGRDKSRAAWNAKEMNLLTLHAGDSDPPFMAECMIQVKKNEDILRGRTKGNTGWLTLGKWEANLGMVRIDGSNAMTADLDFDGKRPKDVKNATPTAAPSGVPQKRFAQVADGVEYWVPGYTAEF